MVNSQGAVSIDSMEQQSVVRAQLSLLKKKSASRRSFGATEVGASEEGVSQTTQVPVTQQAEEAPGATNYEACPDTAPASGAKIETEPPHLTSAERSVPIIKWACQECHNECIPVMRESRCLCGHRMKEHKHSTKDNKSPCASRGCRCNHFFYLVAEGAWILRCRCKHKHTDHDCGPGVHKCSKCAGCAGFDSPWVCNCGHSWGFHKQQTVVITESNIVEELGPEPAARKQHFYRQDGLNDHK